MRSSLLLGFLASWVCALPLFAATTRCPGSDALGKFKIYVAPPKSGQALPLESINAVLPGDWLEYTPSQTWKGAERHAKVALILVPVADSGERVRVLQVEPANGEDLWQVPFRTSVVALALGPKGLSVKKVSSFVRKNPDLMPQLADYAEHSSTVEALVQTLSSYQQSQPGATNLQAALEGFSQKYGVTLPPLKAGQSSSQQANELLHSLLPALSSSPSLDSRQELLNGSEGLAASVATLFYGSPVGLATGGAAVFEDLRTSLFPRTDFRAAFAQTSPSDGLLLCGKRPSDKTDDRIAYLWVRRILDSGPPTARLLHSARLPLGWTSTLEVTTASVAQLRLLSRARDWRLVSAGATTAVPVTESLESTADRFTLDLAHVKLAPGSYHLQAKWDWTPLPVAGTITLVSFPRLASASLTAASSDRLVEGSGVQRARLTAADFEFVDKAELVSAASTDGSPIPIPFTLPAHDPARPASILDLAVNCDTLRPGLYRLRLIQRNGASSEVSLTLHPPDPTVLDLPLRLNLGQDSQKVVLHGTGLERILKITSPGAVWSLAPVPAGSTNLTERGAVIALAHADRQGQSFPATVDIAGIHKPLSLPKAIDVIGPLPQIVKMRESFAVESSVELYPGEIPALAAASFLFQVRHPGPRPILRLSCEGSGDPAPFLTLASGEHRGLLHFDLTGTDSFFLSLDAASTNLSGCQLTAAIENPAAGASPPFPLGRVVLLPEIDSFHLSETKAEPNLYVGTLIGRNLQVIAETGWDAADGHAALGIPTPVTGDPQRQSLQIVMPWPPPSPHAPLFIWLQGEEKGRRTSATY